MPACEICGEEQALTTVRWLIYEEQEGAEFETREVKDVEACEWCVADAGVCEAMDHFADHDDISGFDRLEDESQPTWSCCGLHVPECLEQLVEEVVDGQRSLDAVLALIDDYSTRHGLDAAEIEVMRNHARRLLAPPPTDKRGRINTGLAE